MPKFVLKSKKNAKPNDYSVYKEDIENTNTYNKSTLF